MDRMQINCRLDKALSDRLDQRRAALMSEMGRIPSRSEVLRIALEQYLKDDGFPHATPGSNRSCGAHAENAVEAQKAQNKAQ